MINFKTIEETFTVHENMKASFGKRGMVATACPEATEAGVSLLAQGGNAVDAAVASALALGVAEPQASGLGGQTMMIIGDGKKRVAIDGSSRAPSLAHVNAIYKYDKSVGYRATTVPSTPAALWYVQDKYGKLPWKKVVEPAYRIALDGYHITDLQSALQKRELENFNAVPSLSGARYFLNNREPYAPGTLFKQHDLAKVLKNLMDYGIKDFYSGKIAKAIDADMRENGGLLRYDDLALVPLPIEREPLVRQFRGLDIITMPPPGAGKTLLFALMMLDLLPREHPYEDSATRNLLLIHIIRRAFLERSDRPYDPNFFAQIADEADALDITYAREVLNEILKDVDKSLLPLVPSEDELSGETTHLSVMDEDGMAVSLTQSIERVYGCKAVAEGLGFLYNNYLFDYEYKVPSHPFYLRPNKSPWATVAPTLVAEGEHIWMSLGSPGSERIISVLLQFLSHITDHGMNMYDAMYAPRLHCSLGGRVSLEANRFPESLIPYLQYKELRIDKREDFAFYLGCIQAVLKCHDGSGFQGIADVRRDGIAKGLS